MDWPLLLRKSVHAYTVHASMPKGRNFLLVNLNDTHPRSLSKSITVPCNKNYLTTVTSHLFPVKFCSLWARLGHLLIRTCVMVSFVHFFLVIGLKFWMHFAQYWKKLTWIYHYKSTNEVPHCPSTHFINNFLHFT